MIKVFNIDLSMAIYQLLLNTLPEFRIVIIEFDDLVDVSFTSHQTTVKELNKGCYLCPRSSEEGDHHYCMDGCFNLSRRKKAEKVHKLSRLNGLVRERLLFDTFVKSEESKDCTTVLQANMNLSEDKVPFGII